MGKVGFVIGELLPLMQDLLFVDVITLHVFPLFLLTVLSFTLHMLRDLSKVLLLTEGS